MSPVRTLVVDDSALMRRMVADMLQGDPRIEVAGTAANGKIALAKARDLRPDVVTLDVEMPGMDGLETLSALMETDAPPSVVMLSAFTRRGADLTFRALEAGASDYVAKPEGGAHAFGAVAADLAEKIVAVAAHRPRRRIRRDPPASTRPSPLRAEAIDSEALVGLGISTGGPAALAEVMASLGADAPAMTVVQHMPAPFVPPFAERLGKASGMEVRVAEDGLALGRGRCLIAPGDLHLEVRRAGGGYRAALRAGEKVSGHRPSADVLIRSVAAAAGARAVGVLMTGMGRDGADAMAAVKRAGGRTVAQDKETCVVYGMPKAAVDEGNADRVVPLGGIAAAILDAARSG